MRLILATLAFFGSHMLPRTDEEAAWNALKRGCGYLAAYWMTLGAHCGLQADAARETERLKPSYRRAALAELGESR
jgi:hypothetical protein